MSKILYSLLLFILITNSLFGQSGDEVVIPPFKDAYSEQVKMLEAGHLDIDYRKFRKNFIESEQFLVASRKSNQFDSLQNEMYVQMKKSNYQKVIQITKNMLSIDYTSLRAHKILRQTYKIMGDTANASKYRTIQFGLLNSIVKNGNGMSCETAWPVIQVEEEYFVLEILGAKLSSQGVDQNGGLCDKMEVMVDGQKRTYFFETSDVFAGYDKKLKPK